MMYRFYNYFNIFFVPLFCLYAIGKGFIIGCMAFVLAFVVHPLSDFILDRYFKNMIFKISGGQNSKKWVYEIPLLLGPLFQLILLFTAFKHVNSSLSEAVLSGTLCGLSGGILGIGVAHEMIHRRKKWEKIYGQFMLYIINYPHFSLEHFWHHLKVGMPEDQDTARMSESIYAFLLRSIPQGWLACWRWENKKSKKTSEKLYFLKRKMAKLSFIQLTLHIMIFFFFGIQGFFIYFVQGIVTLLLLKWINYVEHYGLENRIIKGKTETSQVHDSWDTSQNLTNFSLFNLGYHSKHHEKPFLKYYELPSTKKILNELPAGYSTMMMLALIPPLWKSVMRKQINKIITGNGKKNCVS